MEGFGNRLKELRGNRKQAEVAEKIGLKPPTYAMYENDMREPNFQTLNLIADYYGVSADYLLGRTPHKSPNIDIQAICKKTGLSEESVEQMQKGFFYNKQAIGLLNELIALRPFHDCIVYMQAAFDLIDLDGNKTNREYDGKTVTLSGEFASSFFRQSARDKYSEAFGLMELLRRQKENK